MAHVSDFTKPQKEIIVDLINFSNNSNIAASAIELSNAVSVEDRQVQVNITPVPGSGYGGEVDVFYDRLAIQEFSDIYLPDGYVLLPHGEAETLVDLLPQINAQLGINLLPTDVIDKPIEGWPGTPGSFLDIDLDMQPDSLVYFGGLALKLDDNDIALSSVLTVTVLSGLNLPVTDTPDLGELLMSFNNISLDYVGNVGGGNYSLSTSVDTQVASTEYPEVKTNDFPALWWENGVVWGNLEVKVPVTDTENTNRLRSLQTVSVSIDNKESIHGSLTANSDFVDSGFNVFRFAITFDGGTSNDVNNSYGYLADMVNRDAVVPLVVSYEFFYVVQPNLP